MSEFLKSVQTLTPQEFDQFKAELDSNEEMLNKVQKEVDLMDSADQNAFKSMIFGEPANKAEVPQGQKVTSARDIEQRGEPSTMQKVENAAVALGEGALPFREEIGAAIGAGIDYLTGDRRDFHERYDENLHYMVKDYENRKETTPEIVGGAEMAGELSSFVLGGAATSSLKVFKTAGNVKKGAALLTTDFAIEAARNIGNTDYSKPEEIKQAGVEALIATGAGFGLGQSLKLLGKGVKAVGTHAKDMLEDTVIARGSSKLLQNFRTFLADNGGNAFNPSYKQGLRSISYDDVNKVVDEDLTGYRAAIMNRKYDDARLIALNKSKELSNVFADTIDGLEGASKKAQVPSSISPDEVDSLFNTVSNRLNTVMETGSKNAKKAAVDVSKEIRNLFYRGTADDLGNMVYTPKSMGLKSFYSARKYLNDKTIVNRLKKAGFSTNDIDSMFGDITNKFYDRVEDVASAVGADMDTVYQSSRRARVADHFSKQADKMKTLSQEMQDKSLGSTVMSTAFDYARKNNAILGTVVGAGLGVGYAMGGTEGAGAGGIGMLAMATAAGFTSVPKALRAVGNMGDNKVINTMIDVGDFYTSGSGAKSPLYTNMLARLPYLVNGNERALQEFNNKRSGDGWVEEEDASITTLNALNATKELLKSPLDRTTESFIANKNKVYEILASEAPDFINDFEEALNKKEDIGPIISVLAQTPVGKELIKEGIGWDGKAYSEEEKAHFAEKITNNVLIPSSKKIDLLEKLNKFGAIPNLDREPIRRPKKFQRRNKNNQPY